MSFNFAAKDLYHHKEQTKAHLIGNIALVTFFTAIVNISYSLNIVFVPSEITTFTTTFLELFAQYNNVILFLILILVIVYLANSNHALILHRKKDIAIMKAIGSLPRQLYSFYISELLILTTITVMIGVFLGFMVYLIGFMIIENLSGLIVWRVNILMIGLMILGMYGITYAYNGYEIRKIGQQTYNETKSGKISATINARFSEKTRKWLNNKTIGTMMGVKNLARKKHENIQNIILISIAGLIIFTGLIGSIIVANSSNNYLTRAQGTTETFVLGHSDIVDQYVEGITTFQESELPSYTPFNTTDEVYNITSIRAAVSNLTSEYNLADHREDYFIIQQITENALIYLQRNFSNEGIEQGRPYYVMEGDNETVEVFVQGFDYTQYQPDWEYEGTLADIIFGAFIGDTLASEVFEVSLLQDFNIYNNQTHINHTFSINAIVIDPLNNGKTVYLNRADMQYAMGVGDYNNLFFVNYTGLSNTDKFSLKQDLNQVLEGLGEDFVVVDLQGYYDQNERALWVNFVLSIVIVSIMSVIIIYSIDKFQLGRIEEDKRDWVIIKNLGGSNQDLHRSLFIEQAGYLTAGVFLSFGLSILVLVLFLMNNAALPSILLPILILLGVYITLIVIAYFNSWRVLKRYNNEIKRQALQIFI